MLTHIYNQRQYNISFVNCHLYRQKICSTLHTCRSVQIVDFRPLPVDKLYFNDIVNQRTNGPVNAHLISWPTKAQNIQNLENIW